MTTKNPGSQGSIDERGGHLEGMVRSGRRSGVLVTRPGHEDPPPQSSATARTNARGRAVRLTLGEPPRLGEGD